jgi:hypothetical protein
MTTNGTTNLDILELSVPSIEADEIHSGSAEAGSVLTADGSGGAAWLAGTESVTLAQDPPGSYWQASLTEFEESADGYSEILNLSSFCTGGKLAILFANISEGSGTAEVQLRAGPGTESSKRHVIASVDAGKAITAFAVVPLINDQFSIATASFGGGTLSCALHLVAILS